MPERRVEVAHTSASSGGIPNATASRTIELMWPSSAMCSGSRSSVQNAIRAGPVLGEQRQQRMQVARRRRLADQQPHAGAQPLASLLGGVGLVVGADARGDVGVELAAEHAGAWPSTWRASSSFASSCSVAGDDAGEVHHLGEPEHAAAPQQRVEVARRQLAPRRLELRGGHARRRHEPDVERDAGADVEQPVHAVGAEHVRDLVRVGDDRGRPERQHEPRELVDEQLRRLEVHVRVDEARARRSGRRRRASRCPRTRRGRRRSRRRPRRRSRATRA